MNKILVKLYVPMIQEQYDIWIPLNRRIHSVIKLIVRAVYDFSGGYYKPENTPVLYDKLTAKPYDINLNVKDSSMRNGTEIVLI